MTHVHLALLIHWLGLAVTSLAMAGTNEPVVRMLVPGFEVQELPVTLSNQNNLRFAPDGTLTSLGYDGRIWRLKDTDHDGLEDRAELIWDRPTLSVPLGMTWSTAGLFVSSKGKISLLRDTDGNGRFDQEDVVTTGWPATDVASGGVDATAVTLDPEGNLYFGLLGADYSNAYRLRRRSDLKPEEIQWLKAQGRWRDPSGAGSAEDEFSLYDLKSPRGTIQKYDVRKQKLETLATGIRVPVALAFNAEGYLFNTDQEGETWMPNGNPLDELNHIQPGRNYGFPPRHERWLPEIVSESPVVSFGPQHQSVCGLVFNIPQVELNSRSNPTQSRIRASDVPVPTSPGQKVFGPAWWAGDALVAGESRGKIWRVRLVKTPNGFVGRSYTIARLSMLTLDLAISPKGDLYVCCHGGAPDWGTGPQGLGKIFKISYLDKTTPQPVATWVANPTEVRVAFDRALDPSVTNQVWSVPHQDRDKSGTESALELRGDLPTQKLSATSLNSTEGSGENAGRVAITVEFGQYASAGDRHEILKPPYAVVAQQDATPRAQLDILSASFADDDRTLVLTTAPHPLAVPYVLSIPNLTPPGGKTSNSTVELEYDLNGVEVDVLTHSARSSNVGEHPDQRPNEAPLVLAPLTLWLPTPDLNVAEALLYPRNLLREAMNRVGATNGDRLEFRFRTALEAGEVLTLASDSSIERTQRSDLPQYSSSNRKPQVEGTTNRLNSTGWLKFDTNGSYRVQASIPFAGRVTLRRDPTGVDQPLALARISALWAATNRASSGTDSRAASKPDGDWEQGRELFGASKLNCIKCHRVRTDGGLAGPDLSNLVHRDAASVLRDIRDPGATLHPDYVTYQAELKNGEVQVGFIRASAGASLRIVDAEGHETIVARSDLRNLHPTGQSLMPTGLLDGLSESDVGDLMTFLLWEPPVRSRTDVAAAFSSREVPAIHHKTVRIVLVASAQDHGSGQHDYPAWQEKWVRLLASLHNNVAVEKAVAWPSSAQFVSADVLVFYFWNHEWSPTKLAEVDGFQQRGGGIVLLHSATIADHDAEQLAERFGLAAQPGRTGYRHMPFELKIVDHESPLTRGLPDRLPFLDEPYWPLIGNPAQTQVLATAEVDGSERPMVWIYERGRGRVFASILGHYFWTLDDPLFRLLVLRGIAWTGRVDPMTLDEVALVEAAVK